MGPAFSNGWPIFKHAIERGKSYYKHVHGQALFDDVIRPMAAAVADVIARHYPGLTAWRVQFRFMCWLWPDSDPPHCAPEYRLFVAACISLSMFSRTLVAMLPAGLSASFRGGWKSTFATV